MPSRFNLPGYVTTASLVAFAGIAVACVLFQFRSSALVEPLRDETSQTLETLETSWNDQADELVQHDLREAQEDSHTQWARLLSNTLWEGSLAPYLAAARGLDLGRCLALDRRQEAMSTASSGQTQACLRQQAARLGALPQFAVLDARLNQAMRGSAVRAIEIHNLQGITLYATDHTQVGNVRTAPPGAAGALLPRRSASETAFHGWPNAATEPAVATSVVPLEDPRTRNTVALFELQADVTAQLQRVRQSSAEFRQTAALHRAHLEQQATDHRNRLAQAGRMQLAMLAGVAAALVALLSAVLHRMARRTQVLLEQQRREIDDHRRRLAQSGKMTSLGHTLAAVAHQLNAPLAFAKSNVLMATQALKDMEPAIRSAARVLDRAGQNTGAPSAPLPLEPATDPAASAPGLLPDDVRVTQDMLADVLAGLNRMHELVDSLRSFSRVDRPRREEVDLNKALDSVIHIARAVVSTRIRLVRNFTPLPGLTCDLSQLNTVFFHLVMDAAQAIDGAGVITLSTAKSGDLIRIRIEHTGRGLRDGIRPHTFDPHSTSQSLSSGSGLGLSAARDIVAEHGGTLSVNTGVGTGTTVQIELPIPPIRPT